MSATATLLKVEHDKRGRAMVVRCPRCGQREVHRLSVGEQAIGAARPSLCDGLDGRLMYVVTRHRRAEQ